MPNLVKAQNYSNWQNDPMILAELYTCVWQMDALYGELAKEDVLPLMNLSKINIMTAGMSIANALEKLHNTPIDDKIVDMYKQIANTKIIALKQKNSLWLEMTNCGVSLARSGF